MRIDASHHTVARLLFEHEQFDKIVSNGAGVGNREFWLDLLIDGIMIPRMFTNRLALVILKSHIEEVVLRVYVPDDDLSHGFHLACAAMGALYWTSDR